MVYWGFATLTGITLIMKDSSWRVGHGTGTTGSIGIILMMAYVD